MNLNVTVHFNNIFNGKKREVIWYTNNFFKGKICTWKGNITRTQKVYIVGICHRRDRAGSMSPLKENNEKGHDNHTQSINFK